MDKLVVNGGKPLNGSIEIGGAKNAAVAIVAAAIMPKSGISVLENIPEIEDIECIETIIRSLGCSVKRNGNLVEIDSTKLAKTSVDTEEIRKYARKMRGSYYIIGALLGRCGTVITEPPGGCAIGVRPIDQHIKGFEALGAKVEIKHGIIEVSAEKLVGANIYFDVVSVGATINVMLAAALAEGTTILENAAKEPHVVDVANFLNTMGANVKGAGTDVIRIVGVKELKGCNYSVIPDQMEAATYMIATAACGGKVVVKNIIPKHLESVSAKLVEMGAKIEEGDDYIVVESDRNLKGVNIKTLPYPGFPTDAQQPMSTLLCTAKGRSIINESIWESRLKHVDELKKMGANIKVEGRIAIIDGVDKLTGASVKATDLRAGAAMVIAALSAEGISEISCIEHIDRGYPHIEDKFRKLGADIKRVSI